MNHAARLLAALSLVLVSGLSSLVEATPLTLREPEAGGRAAGPLTLRQVIRSTAQHHPEASAALEKRQGALAAQDAATGVWNPLFEAEGAATEVGYYRYRQLDMTLTQYTPLWGSSLFAGYRVGTGDFPVYRLEHETLGAGELRAGVQVPLWRDGPIDSQRASLEKSEQLASAARCEELHKQLSLQRRAAFAYWGWVAAGRVADIERELLSVAERRQEAIATQAELGILAPIVVLDNERLVFDRKLKKSVAERSLREAAITLSLYYRDESGRPVLVGDEQLPNELPTPGRPNAVVDIRVLREAVDRRPETCVLGRHLATAEVDVELTENRVAPNIDAKAYAARDLGAGRDELRPTELAVGLSVKLPIGLSQARGEHEVARAKQRELSAQLRNLQDLIAADVRTALVRLQTAFEQWQLAHEQLSTARQLAEAERVKFQQGASDLVVVNLRELAAADAAKQEVTAAAEYQKARVDYETSLGRRL